MHALTSSHHPHESAGSAAERFDGAEALAALTSACRTLSGRDAHILHRRFWCGWTQHEIGAELGVSQLQVSRLLIRILRRLRKILIDSAP